MTCRVTVDAAGSSEPAAVSLYEQLETGGILFFPTSPILPTEDDRAFLIQQKQATLVGKNISYRPAQDRIRGLDQKDWTAHARVHQVLRDHSRAAVHFLERFLPRYARDWTIDQATFRPVEEQGRKLKTRARNDLIHIDNFPSRPSHGRRLLRFFTNIHPDRPRVWVTSDPFGPLARRHAAQVGLPRPHTPLDRARRRVKQALARLGLPVIDRPPYDDFMLRFHHFMKESASFQRVCPKQRWEFPPGSSWICFTDTTSHACPNGQFALEQTFIVSRQSLARPDLAPISILEELAGWPLAAAGK